MASQADADAFRTLNEEWIINLFRLEDPDRVILADPQRRIVDGGGQVYVAASGDRVAATAALVCYAPGVFELAKMAVAPDVRGQGLGRLLLAYVVEQAKQLGAMELFLGSSTRLQNAVHLYEAIGFKHVPRSALQYVNYERADVFMTMDLR